MIEDEILRKLELGNKILKKYHLYKIPFQNREKYYNALQNAYI